VSPESEPKVDPCSGTRSISGACFGFAIETRNGSSNLTTTGFTTASSSSSRIRWAVPAAKSFPTGYGS
jgi:hypothetical protein